jgi:hypothetical protein
MGHRGQGGGHGLGDVVDGIGRIRHPGLRLDPTAGHLWMHLHQFMRAHKNNFRYLDFANYARLAQTCTLRLGQYDLYGCLLPMSEQAGRRASGSSYAQREHDVVLILFEERHRCQAFVVHRVHQVGRCQEEELDALEVTGVCMYYRCVQRGAPVPARPCHNSVCIIFAREHRQRVGQGRLGDHDELRSGGGPPPQHGGRW